MQRFASARYGISLGVVLIAVLESVSLANGVQAVDGGALAHRIVAAVERADLVVLGRVTAKRNYLPVDGGFGYDIVVSETLNGAESRSCSFRAGGWAHKVDLGVGAEVLLFLEQSEAFLPAEHFRPALGADHQPLVFLILEGRLAAGASVSEPGWEGRSLDEVRAAMAALE